MRVTPFGQDGPRPGSVDLADSELYRSGDPHGLWRVMRAQFPVWWQEPGQVPGFWSVFRHADVLRVLRDHRAFSSEGGNMLSALGSGDPAGGGMLAASDPPHHTVVRDVLAPMFSPSARSGHAEEVRDAVRQALRPVLDGQPFDLAEVSGEVAMAIVGPVIGVPEADRDRLAWLSTMAIAPDDEMYCVRDRRTTLMTAHMEIFQYFSDLLESRVPTPSHQMLGLLRDARPGGEPLTPADVVYNCYGMLLGASVTTPHVAAAGLLALSEHPEQRAKLAAAPRGGIPALIDEAVRWSSPSIHFMRHAREDVDISGTLIRAGEPVVAWIGSANRDEEVFADPFTFDATRSPNRHLGFGMGRHYCLGAAVARSGLTVLFEEALRSGVELKLTGEIRHLRSHTIAGFASLPAVAARVPDGVDAEHP